MLIDELRKITGLEINPVVATKSDIVKAIEEFYGGLELIKRETGKPHAINKIDLKDVGDSSEESLSIDNIIARAKAAPVVKLVDLMIWQAINKRASDIHIEPFEDRFSLRYRVDGKLYEIPPPPKHLFLPIVSRIKILSKLDIAERRLPQDGPLVVKLEDRSIDIRVSVVPTLYGEKVVMRILDRSGVILELSEMGFEPDDLETLRQAIGCPYGLVFLTGPTGSGKSTTLYAILQEIKSSEKNIITVEDPVEYRLDGVNQVQVKPEIGLTFANALRSFLRQDPDIMLVGEVRDLETAEMRPLGIDGSSCLEHPSHQRCPIGRDKAHRYRCRVIPSRANAPRCCGTAAREETLPGMQGSIQTHYQRTGQCQAQCRHYLQAQGLSRVRPYRI